MQEGSAYFDDVKIKPLILKKIAIINPDNYRILKQGIKRAIGGTSMYFSIAAGTVPDGCDGFLNPECWTGVGVQSDFIGSILENEGYNVDYYEATDIPLIDASDYRVIIVQDPLRTNSMQFDAQEAESEGPDLLEYVTDSTFLNQLDDYINSGGNVILVGDSVKILEKNYGKTVVEYNINHQVEVESSRIPYKWLFVRGAPFCGLDRVGSAVVNVESSPIIASGNMLASLSLKNLNDWRCAETWSETIYYPNDGTSLLDVNFIGTGQYVLDGSVCNPTQYNISVDDTIQHMMGYTTYNGNKIYYIGSDSFFDYHYKNNQGAWHAGQYSEILYQLSDEAKSAIVNLIEMAINQNGEPGGN